MCNDSENILKFIQVYPDYKDCIGFSLKEFINSETKEEYIAVISERLSMKILSGKPSKVIERLRCLLSFDRIETVDLDKLMEKRNRVVHEGKVYPIDLDELEEYYDLLENILKAFALGLGKLGVHVVDEGELLKT